MTQVSASPYEQEAIKQIHDWKTPTQSWFDNPMKIVNWPIEKAGELVLKTPGIGPVIEKACSGILTLLNDAALWSVRPEEILKEYERFEDVNDLESIFTLDLEEVDRVVGWLAAKYKGLGGAEGIATGAAGLPGIPVDIVALLTINMRAIGEYASYYGFDINLQSERLFALNILGYASSPTDAAKEIAMAQLVKIAREVAVKKTWKNLEQHAFVKVVKDISQTLGTRLTKAKLAQVVPVLGAAVGGGFNVYYTSKVCDAAFNLYRERFLAEKYGEDYIEITVEPAKNLEPDYGAELDLIEPKDDDES